MKPSDYAQEMCLLGSALLQQAEVTQEGEWMVEAIDAYHAAIEADSDLLEPYLALGYLWLLHGQPEQARPFLAKAMDLSPFDPYVQHLWKDFEAASRPAAG